MSEQSADLCLGRFGSAENKETSCRTQHTNLPLRAGTIKLRSTLRIALKGAMLTTAQHNAFIQAPHTSVFLRRISPFLSTGTMNSCSQRDPLDQLLRRLLQNGQLCIAANPVLTPSAAACGYVFQRT